MNLVHSEQMKRDSKDLNVYYTTRNIDRIFSVYAVEYSTIPVGVIQYEGRRVTIDMNDIPDDVPVYITYFEDDVQHNLDIIPMWKMVESLYSSFGGRQYCRLSENYLKEKLIYNINYLNRTKINQYYNRQFCFNKATHEIKCVCVKSACCDKEPAKFPDYDIKCACGSETPCNNPNCAIDEPTGVEYPKRYFLPKNAPKKGILRLDTGEYVEYEELKDGLHLNSQHNIADLQNYVI